MKSSNYANFDYARLSLNLSLKHPKLAEYIERLQKTDDPAERKAILAALEESNRGLITQVAVDVAERGGDFDDACQNARLGMIQAALKVDPARGNDAIYHYISRSMSHEAGAPLRRAANTKVKFRSLDEPIGKTEDGDEVTLADVMDDKNQKTPLEAAIENEESLRVGKMWEVIDGVLTPDQAQLFRAYVECGKAAEAARQVHYPNGQRVYREINRIKATLQKKLARFNDAA